MASDFRSVAIGFTDTNEHKESQFSRAHQNTSYCGNNAAQKKPQHRATRFRLSQRAFQENYVAFSTIAGRTWVFGDQFKFLDGSGDRFTYPL